MNTKQLFEPKPRWPGAPPICLEVNLLAFESEKEIKAFADDIRSSIVVIWKCDFCNRYHYEPKPSSPSGSSSGKTRPSWPGQWHAPVKRKAEIKNEAEEDF